MHYFTNYPCLNDLPSWLSNVNWSAAVMSDDDINDISRLRFLLSFISVITACPIGMSIAAVAVLLSHIDRKQEVHMKPRKSLRQKKMKSLR